MDLIETYWDVKNETPCAIDKCTFDLIETYWDVKKCCKMVNGRYEGDLIETYWDVKEGLNKEQRDRWRRFNRNILGCKAFLSVFLQLQVLLI